MSDHTLALLRDANPAPVAPIDDRPTAAEMLAVAQSNIHAASDANARHPLVVMALAAALVVVLIGVLGVFRFTTGGPQEPSSPSVPQTETTQPKTTETTQPKTTEVPPPTSTSTSQPPVVSVDSQRTLDEFVVMYTNGDVGGLLALLGPGVVKTTHRDAELEFRWNQELLHHQLTVDATLNTSLELVSCLPLQSGSVSCLARRENDLTRIAGVGPQDDRVTLRVEEGMITVWQDRQGFHATPYQQLAVAPFTAWLAQAHPEIPDPHPLEGGVSYWWPDLSIVDRLPSLLNEYAGQP